MSGIHIVLLSPQIPQNTGNIGRLCSILAARLHLIHPLGFEISDSKLKRSGMDYWRSLDVHHHADFAGFMQSPQRPQRLWLFTTHATCSFWQASYAPGDGLVFGNESSGAPAWAHEAMASRRLRIDHVNRAMRSLNLSTSVGIAAYEMLRQLRMGEGGLG